MTMKRLRTTLATLTVLFTCAVLPEGAAAGTYQVTGTCGAWSLVDTAPQRITVYEACPRLIARNVMGNFKTRVGSQADWIFTAPPGTTLEGATFTGDLRSGASWRTQIFTRQPGGYGRTLEQCDRAQCYIPLTHDYDFEQQGRIVARVSCVDREGCPNDGGDPRAQINIASSSIVVSDPSPPTTTIVGGSIDPAGWSGGVRTVNLSGTDNTGIQVFDALVDGDARYGVEKGLGCDYSKRIPCSNHPSVEVPVDLRGLPDGQHALVGRALDAAGNLGDTAPQVFNVDNTPPLAPRGARLVHGSRFRTKNSFGVRWRNPAEAFAPITGANYRVCPQDEPLGSPRCQSGTRDGTNLTRVDGIALPGPGAWRLRLWLYDAAGNSTPTNGVTVGGLGLIAGRRAADGSKRRSTTLTAGHRQRRRLSPRPRVKLGERVKLRGRLTVGRGKRRGGLSGRQLLVYRRPQIQGARYKRVGKVLTDKRGRYRFNAGTGPSRKLQVVFPGGGKNQGEIAKVSVRVRAKLSMRADRKNVRNGEAVALSGRLRGGKVPAGGAPLELQVYVRDRWRPFATPRTDAGGRYLYQYRFETVQGTARFRFRAVLRRQPTYPFTGRSRPVKVRVRGL